MAADGSPELSVGTGSHPDVGEGDKIVEMQDVDAGKMGDMERLLFLQAELYADEENDSYEIKRKKRMARAALTTWKEERETCKHGELQGKSEIRSTSNEVYQLVGLYSVFMGVVLTSVATSSRLECEHLWSPVSLSLFAYSMLVVVAFQKFTEIRRLEGRIEKDLLVIQIIDRWVSEFRERGYADFDFERDCHFEFYPIRRPPLWRNALGLLVPLTIFTAGLVFSLVHILCWS